MKANVLVPTIDEQPDIDMVIELASGSTINVSGFVVRAYKQGKPTIVLKTRHKLAVIQKA